MNTLRQITAALIISASFFAIAPCYAAHDYAEDSATDDPRFDTNAPKAYSMIGDFFIARPMLLAATAVGTGVFIVSLPFTILSNSVGDAADALVVAPARETFVRCLGCTSSGANSNSNSNN